MADYDKTTEWARDIADIEKELTEVSDRRDFLHLLSQCKRNGDRSGFFETKSSAEITAERVDRITQDIMGRYKGLI